MKKVLVTLIVLLNTQNLLMADQISGNTIINRQGESATSIAIGEKSISSIGSIVNGKGGDIKNNNIENIQGSSATSIAIGKKSTSSIGSIINNK